MASPAIRVCIVEDQPDVRKSLAALIAGSEGFECTGAFESMEAALDGMGRGSLPEVALIDINLPGMDGIEGVRKVRARWPSICPVTLTIHDDDERIVESIVAGSNGYLLKNTPPDRLLEALRDSAGGGSPMSPEIARRFVELFRRFQPAPDAGCELTPYEMRILKLLVSGENYKTASGKLKVSVHAISYHVRHIYEKLQVHSRSEAVSKALRSGLVRL
jgi:DNA-binding NarL/FixJ family response regulator